MSEFIQTVRGLILHGQDVLVLDRPDTSRHNPGLTELPGGTIEPHETVEAAALREISVQESAISYEALTAYLHCYDRPLTGNRLGTYRAFGVLGRALTRELIAGSTPEEVLNLRWEPLDRFWSLPLTPDSREIARQLWPRIADKPH